MRVTLFLAVACLALVSATRLEHLIKGRKSEPMNSPGAGKLSIPAGTVYYKTTLNGADEIRLSASQDLLDTGKSVDEAQALNLGLPTQPPPPGYEPQLIVPPGTSFKFKDLVSGGDILTQSETALDDLLEENYAATVEVGQDNTQNIDGHQEAIDVNIKSRARKYAEDPDIPAFTIPANTQYYKAVLDGATSIKDEATAAIEDNKYGVWTAAVENQRAENTELPQAILDKRKEQIAKIPDGTAFLKNVIDSATTVADDTDAWLQGTTHDLAEAKAINEAVAKNIF